MPPNRSVRRFGQAIGKRPPDVDPKLPACMRHRRILHGRRALVAVARPESSKGVAKWVLRGERRLFIGMRIRLTRLGRPKESEVAQTLGLFRHLQPRSIRPRRRSLRRIILLL